ncbi:GatB/YqeY domain-containing protein [Patescibacteria group bacterium]
MIRDTLKAQLTQNIKDRNMERVGVLRMLIAAINNKEIAFRSQNIELEDKHVIKAINKEIKQRKDSIESYEKGNRQDLADKEKSEMVILEEILKEFAPEEPEVSPHE